MADQNTLWLLQGDPSAPGWAQAEKDAKAKTLDWRLFDRLAWILVRGAEPPTAYEGLTPTEPPDGVYVDPNGNAAYLVAGREVKGPMQVIEALGPRANELYDKLGDADAVLERLGRAY